MKPQLANYVLVVEAHGCNEHDKLQKLSRKKYSSLETLQHAIHKALADSPQDCWKLYTLKEFCKNWNSSTPHDLRFYVDDSYVTFLKVSAKKKKKIKSGTPDIQG